MWLQSRLFIIKYICNYTYVDILAGSHLGQSNLGQGHFGQNEHLGPRTFGPEKSARLLIRSVLHFGPNVYGPKCLWPKCPFWPKCLWPNCHSGPNEIQPIFCPIKHHHCGLKVKFTFLKKNAKNG